MTGTVSVTKTKTTTTMTKLQTIPSSCDRIVTKTMNKTQRQQRHQRNTCCSGRESDCFGFALDKSSGMGILLFAMVAVTLGFLSLLLSPTGVFAFHSSLVVITNSRRRLKTSTLSTTQRQEHQLYRHYPSQRRTTTTSTTQLLWSPSTNWQQQETAYFIIAKNQQQQPPPRQRRRSICGKSWTRTATTTTELSMCQLLGMNCAAPTEVSLTWPRFCERGGRTDIHADGWGLVRCKNKSKSIAAASVVLSLPFFSFSWHGHTVSNQVCFLSLSLSHSRWLSLSLGCFS